MKKIAVVTLSMLLFGACSADAGKLTNDRVARTLKEWINNPDTVVTVTGVTEVPAQNIANADVQLSHFFYMQDGTRQDYSGPTSKVVFTHYNDGRWVLTEFQIDQGLAYHAWWQHLNVEVR